MRRESPNRTLVRIVSERPRLLDLYCGGGGAAAGYAAAGFDVIGVDIRPQPHYPYTFVRADALAVDLAGFDAIHASPPCQHYASGTRDPTRHPDLYALTRRRLIEAGVPFVIENVIGAPYSHGFVLCGSMFGLAADGEWLRRHRNFETSWLLLGPPACAHPPAPRPVTITGHSWATAVREHGHSRQGPYDLACRLMGIDWLDRAELTEAIPPAYTEWIGRQLLAVLQRAD